MQTTTQSLVPGLRKHSLRARALAWLLPCITWMSPTAVSEDATGNCVFVAGECCTVRPNFRAAAYAGFGSSVAVMTASSEALGASVVTIHDLGSPGTGLNAGPFNTNWPGAIYSDPSWSDTNLGNVFGVTLDDQGNIFVSSTACYNVDLLGFGGTGVVYKIDGVTSVVTVFANLPNSGQELGNLCFDCDHDQFFVSNMDDGRIYRLSTAGVVLSTFDFGAPDNPLDGFAPLGERIWAVQKHNGRVYFSVWRENAITAVSLTEANEIWSIALDGTGEFFGAPRLEITLPVHHANYSNPVSDMRFSQTGSLFVAEKGMWDETTPIAHEARLLEFVCVNGSWALGANTFTVGHSSGGDSCGGVDVSPGPCGRVFVTGDSLDAGSQSIYGAQVLPLGGGSLLNSNLIDFNGSLVESEKSFIGDIAVPCKVPPDECAPPTPGHPTCRGQGCPCMNDSPVSAQAGCLNTTGSGGKLTGTGTPYSEYSVCPSTSPPGLDTVTLTATGLPSNVFGIVFRGTTNLNGGAGLPFGYGLRCCGGQITRSGAQSSGAAGVMNFGYPVTKLSVKTLSCAAVTYCYQVWYRDVPGGGPLCAEPFNTSNAYEITWLP